MSMFSWSVFLVVFLIAIHELQAQAVHNDDGGPIHEAFVTRITENIPLEAVDRQPPLELNESVPKQLDMQSEWISGYWSWNAQRQDFIWISGVWRRPPPGHHWIPGFWTKTSEGWTWITGYWKSLSSHQTDYIGVIPPDPIDENTLPPPTSKYFWIPGYWYFVFDKEHYQWVSGSWEEVDPQWVFSPAHYVWHPRGYIFVAAYWDWPLEKRGTIYANMRVEPTYRHRILFTPHAIVKTSNVVMRLFQDYPDYRCFFSQHWLTHPKFWGESRCTPPWWKWETWWCYAWQDLWSLWWWYTHPGYPQPLWLSAELASILPSPSSELLLQFENHPLPPVVTLDGCISGDDLHQAIRKEFEEFVPILPADPEKKQKILAHAKSALTPLTECLKPTGYRLPIDPSAARPQVCKPVIDSEAMATVTRLRPDLRPKIPYKPKIPSHGGPPIWQTKPTDALVETSPSTHRSTWTPQSSQPSKLMSNPPVPTVKHEDDSSWIPSQMQRQAVPRGVAVYRNNFKIWDLSLCQNPKS